VPGLKPDPFRCELLTLDRLAQIAGGPAIRQGHGDVRVIGRPYGDPIGATGKANESSIDWAVAKSVGSRVGLNAASRIVNA
jgi:hypothetical protein